MTLQDKDVVIEVCNVAKSYGPKRALRNANLTVYAGETLAIIGPNGAGKTTLIEIIIGLRRADSGDVRLFGNDRPGSASAQRRLGVQLQDGKLIGRASVREYLRLFSTLYDSSSTVEDLADRLNLRPCLDRKVGKLSGGEYQRLQLALALVGNPEIILLDEPTTGLDPIARRDLWSMIRELQQSGRTLLLITHYMDEVEKLCDRVALVVGGEVVATGTSAEMAEFAGMPGQNLDDAYANLITAAGAVQ